MRKTRSPLIGRRALLIGSAAGGALLACPRGWGRSAAGAQGRSRKLVIVLASGGWDTTYVLDPKPGSPYVDVPEGDVRVRGGIPIYSHPTRPAVDAFFDRWGANAVVVNGLQVRSFVHPDCIKRVLTGSPSETTPDMGAITAHALGRELPVPYLALGSQARSGPYAALTGRTGATNQLSALVDPRAAYPAPGSVRPDPGFQPSAQEADWIDGYLTAGAGRLRRRRAPSGLGARRVEDYLQALARAEQLKAFATEGRGLGLREYTLAMEVQIPLAVRALGEGLSQVVMLQTDGWDTHENNARQAPLHENLFSALDALARGLETDQLLDDTLVVVVSEMGRTPRLNGEAGKDHWPVTSAVLFGAGVAGGRVLGGTSESQDALSMRLDTGAIDAAGKQLQASNFVAGVLEAVGIDPQPYLPQVEPFRAFMA